jgi:hypothetical protein
VFEQFAVIPQSISQSWTRLMASKLDDLFPTIIGAADSGISIGKITERFVGKSKAKQRTAELRERLAALVRDGAIRGPLKYRGTQHYFAAGRGPSIETASDTIVRLVARSGVKLMSKAGLEDKVTGMNRRFFADGLQHAVASWAILELSCGKRNIICIARWPPTTSDLGQLLQNRQSGRRNRAQLIHVRSNQASPWRICCPPIAG